MRVLYYYASQQFDTGSPRSLVDLVGVLDRSRYTPLFLASGDGPLLDALERQDVQIVRGPVERVSWRRPLDGLARIRAQMRRLREWKVDLLHLNEQGWNYDLVLAAWRLGVPVVLHLRLPETIEFQNLHRFAAARVIIVSSAQRATIRGFDRIRGKAVVVHNAVDTAWYGAGHSIRDALGLAPDDVVVTTVAQLRADKGIDVVLEVARRLLPQWPRLVFLIVGPKGRGESEFGDRMIAVAEEPAFRGRVRFIGSRKDVPEVLASSDVFLLPTRAETFGRAVAEAMAASVPIVASGIDAIAEIVTGPELGVLVDPIDADGFTAALAEVLARPDRGRAMGERGKQSLVGRFDRATLASRLDALYSELL